MGHARGVIALAAGLCSVVVRRALARHREARADRKRCGAQRTSEGDGLRPSGHHSSARTRRRLRRPRPRARLRDARFAPQW